MGRRSSSCQTIPLSSQLLFRLTLIPGNVTLRRTIGRLTRIRVIHCPLNRGPPRNQITRVLNASTRSTTSVSVICYGRGLPHTFSRTILTTTRKLPAGVHGASAGSHLSLHRILALAVSNPGIAIVSSTLALRHASDNR